MCACVGMLRGEWKYVLEVNLVADTEEEGGKDYTV